MIETKKQYEEIMRHTPFYEGGEKGAVRETIEALREVVRAAKIFGQAGTGYSEARLFEKLYALPDWITEE